MHSRILERRIAVKVVNAFMIEAKRLTCADFNKRITFDVTCDELESNQEQLAEAMMRVSSEVIYRLIRSGLSVGAYTSSHKIILSVKSHAPNWGEYLTAISSLGQYTNIKDSK